MPLSYSIASEPFKAIDFNIKLQRLPVLPPSKSELSPTQNKVVHNDSLIPQDCSARRFQNANRRYSKNNANNSKVQVTYVGT
jgi:hypothetical protein